MTAWEEAMGGECKITDANCIIRNFFMGVAGQSGQLVFESRYFIPLLDIKNVGVEGFFPQCQHLRVTG